MSGARKPHGDIAAGRLDGKRLAANFADVAPTLDRQSALIEAQRCYYCYDAPCIAACPTGIEIPRFIQRIASGDLTGAAQTILEANPLGGICARVCPTEILCEGSCVRNTDESKPVEIGALQRVATDWVFRDDAKLFSRAAATGKRVAVVGAGPAGLACAHGLARRGHEVVVFEAREKSGGLNEYGIAAYKVPGFAQREVDWLLAIGGISVRHGQALGRELSLAKLAAEFDAVFVGVGLAGVNALGLDGEQRAGVRNAVDFIAELRQAGDLASVAIGRRVVVVGGGNTAVDAAVQSRKLGAESVTMLYRRDVDTMSATEHERDFARTQGVNLITAARPVGLEFVDGSLARVECEHTRLVDGQWQGSGDRFHLEADLLLKAVGQVLLPASMNAADGAALLSISKGRIDVDAELRTSLAKVWAGGDCIARGQDLTVRAVEDGKRAAVSIDRALQP